MTSKDFYTSTTAEIYLRLKGYEKIRWEAWEQARLISYNIYSSIPRKSGSVLKSIEKFYPLPSDKDNFKLKPDSEMKSVWDKLKQRENG